MLLEEIKNIKSTYQDLKKFGLTIGICGIIASIFLLIFQNKIGIYFLTIGVLFIIMAFLRPVILKPVQKTWMAIAVIMGFWMTKIILFLAFFLIITPIGLVMKTFGKKFLEIKIDKNKNSYWNIINEDQNSQESYHKQY